MNHRIPPQPTHPYSPAPVIAYSATMARQSGRTCYVEAMVAKFAFTYDQPSPLRSHWRIDPDGAVSAHLAQRTAHEYRYERI